MGRLSRFRRFRAFAAKRSPGAPPRFDFDALAKELANGLTRRQALRRFALGVAAGMLAEFTDLLHGAWLAPAVAAQPVPSAGSCSSDQVNQCLQQVQTELAPALMSCTAPPSGSQLAAVLPPWLQQADTLNCLDQVGAMASQDQQNCMGIGCPAGSFCSSNACCPEGLVGCGGRCCGECCAGDCCAAGESCCFGRCVDTQNDASHCGGCGNVCASGACVGGVCGGCNPPCAAGATCVSGTCRCGAGPACAAGQSCVNGACTGGIGQSGTGSQQQKQVNALDCSSRCKGGCCDDQGVCRVNDPEACGSGGGFCAMRCDTPEAPACVGGFCCVRNSAGTGCCPSDKICCHTYLASLALPIPVTTCTCCDGANEVCDGDLCCEKDLLCTSPSRSGGTCCTGCCDDGICRAGTRDDLCGANNQTCKDCTKAPSGGPGYKCINQTCCIPDATGTRCQQTNCPGAPGGRCPSGFTCCNPCPGVAAPACVNLQTNLDPSGRPTRFCGSCGNLCAIGANCVGGACLCEGAGNVCTQQGPWMCTPLAGCCGGTNPETADCFHGPVCGSG